MKLAGGGGGHLPPSVKLSRLGIPKRDNSVRRFLRLTRVASAVKRRHGWTVWSHPRQTSTVLGSVSSRQGSLVRRNTVEESWIRPGTRHPPSTRNGRPRGSRPAQVPGEPRQNRLLGRLVEVDHTLRQNTMSCTMASRPRLDQSRRRSSEWRSERDGRGSGGGIAHGAQDSAQVTHSGFQVFWTGGV